MERQFKRINEVFTIEEFEKLQKVKNEKNLNWHDFILLLLKEEKK